MKQHALQEFVKKIFSDETARSQFGSNPDSFLSKFKLTALEKKAVLRTHSKLGIVGSNSQHLEATLDTTGDWAVPPPGAR